jgi:hypothetical protein
MNDPTGVDFLGDFLPKEVSIKLAEQVKSSM